MESIGGSSAGLSHEASETGGAETAAALGGGQLGAEEREPLLDRALAAAFTVFADATDSTVVSQGAWYVLQLVGLLQLLLLPLGPDGTWSDSAQPSRAGVAGLVPAFQAFLLPVTFTPWVQTAARTGVAPFGTLTLWAASAAFMCALLGLFGALAWRAFLSDAKGAAGGLRASPSVAKAKRREGRVAMLELRTLLALGVIALPVPLAGNLLLPVACPSGTWAGGACWVSTTHIGAAVVSIVLLALGLPFLVAAAALFQSRLPDLKLHPTAVAHGFADAGGMVVKVLMAATFIVGQASPPWVRHAVFSLGALALLALVLVYLPHLNQGLNRARAFLDALLLAACVSALIVSQLQLTVAFAWAAGTGAVFLVLLVPVLGYSAWLLAALRFASLQRSKDVSSPVAIEMRLRYMLASALASAASSAAPLMMTSLRAMASRVLAVAA